MTALKVRIPAEVAAALRVDMSEMAEQVAEQWRRDVAAAARRTAEAMDFEVTEETNE